MINFRHKSFQFIGHLNWELHYICFISRFCTHIIPIYFDRPFELCVIMETLILPKSKVNNLILLCAFHAFLAHFLIFKNRFAWCVEFVMFWKSCQNLKHAHRIKWNYAFEIKLILKRGRRRMRWCHHDNFEESERIRCFVEIDLEVFLYSSSWKWYPFYPKKAHTSGSFESEAKACIASLINTICT